MKRVLLLLLACFWVTADVRADDWYRWRGPDQTGVSHDKDLPDRFSLDPQAPDSNLIWRAPYGGRSTPIIMNGRLYYIRSVGQGITGQEQVVCLNADTGEKIWDHKFNVWHTDIDILRVGWTNLAGDPETGNVYMAGTQGLFVCFDRDGKILWHHSLTEEYGRISGYGGRNSSPVVAGDLVVYGMLNASWGDQAPPGNRFVAFDKKTGAVRWWSSPTQRPKDTYASVPVLATINGERLLITGAGDGGVYALRAETGERVWGYLISQGGLSSTPVVHGNHVFICQGAENLDTAVQGNVVCVDGGDVKDGKPKLLWQHPGIKVRYTSPCLHEDRLYAVDENGRLHCLDIATGKEVWGHKVGQGAKASPVWADGKIYACEETSRFHILQPGKNRCKTLYVQFFPNPDGPGDLELAGSPAVANGKVYFATSREMYCIGKKSRVPPRVESQTATDADTPEGAKPAHIQVVPADIVLEPGGTAEFKVLAYDAHGHFLKEVKADKWSLPTPTPPTPPGGKPPPPPPPLKGQVDNDGKLTVDRTPPGQFGYVGAQIGELTSRARIRVVSTLPIAQNFKNIPVGRFPGGWVNCQLKFAVEDKGGEKVLVKLANNASPLFARAQAYIGLPDWSDYTIESDVMANKKGENLPDVGVTANRYTLFLHGNHQVLQLVSWESTPRARVDKEVHYPWKENTWYHIKLTTDVEGEKVQIRGKVWERGQQEPDKWMLEFEDPNGNKNGAPAIYGFSTGIIEREIGAQSFYDNVRVTPNKR